MKKTKSEIADLVRESLSGVKYEDDITFTVEEKGVQVGDGWYRVSVRPSRLPQRLFALYEFIAEHEVDISDAEGINLLLSIGDPTGEEEAPANSRQPTAATK